MQEVYRKCAANNVVVCNLAGTKMHELACLPAYL